MERRNFFTSGWLFLTIAIVNVLVAVVFGIVIMCNRESLDEWFAPLCMLVPLSVALGIVAIFLPRQKIGVKRGLTIAFNGVSALFYMMALISIITYWVDSAF